MIVVLPTAPLFFLKNNIQIFHRPFTQEERVFSSTHRELIAMEYSLKAFGPILCNSRVKLFTDSQSSVRIVEVGSVQFSLHTLAIIVFFNFVFGITELSVQWISRSLNQKADSVSKFTDIDDWQITSEFFGLLEQYWGPHTIDFFANFYNTKIERFFSKFWNPGTAGLDAFFQSWQNENCLLVPPFTLVCETLRHMNRDSAVGTLVIPDWPSSAFWPLLLGHYKKRSSHPPVVKKEPVDLDMIKSIINNYASSVCNLKDLRFATMSTLLYVGLFRSQELLDMKLWDLDVAETYLEVRFSKSKTDIYRLGQTVFIPKSGLYTCPYSLLIRYLNMSKTDLNQISSYLVMSCIIRVKVLLP